MTEQIRIDPKALQTATSAARAASTVDVGSLSAAAGAARATQFKMNMIDIPAMQKAMEGLGSTRPAQMDAFSEALKQINIANTQRLSNAIGTLDLGPTFGARIAESVKAVDLGPAFAARLAEAAKNIDFGSALSKPLAEAVKKADFGRTFGAQVSEALRQASPPIGSSAPAPDLAHLARGAVALAESQPVQELSEGWSREFLAGLSADKIRELHPVLLSAIASLLGIVASLTKSGHVDLAGNVLGFAACLIAIYFVVSRFTD